LGRRDGSALSFSLMRRDQAAVSERATSTALAASAA
jgi:hypothetical protein